jgi:hypothetical protein
VNQVALPVTGDGVPDTSIALAGNWAASSMTAQPRNVTARTGARQIRRRRAFLAGVDITASG